jgi:hypothetical protein
MRAPPTGDRCTTTTDDMTRTERERSDDEAHEQRHRDRGDARHRPTGTSLLHDIGESVELGSGRFGARHHDGRKARRQPELRLERRRQRIEVERLVCCVSRSDGLVHRRRPWLCVRRLYTRTRRRLGVRLEQDVLRLDLDLELELEGRDALHPRPRRRTRARTTNTHRRALERGGGIVATAGFQRIGREMELRQGQSVEPAIVRF